MKALIFLISALCMGSLASFELACSDRISAKETNEKEHNVRVSVSNSVVFWGNNYGLIYQKSNKKFYLVQYQTKPSTNKLFTDATIEDYGNDFIRFREAGTNNIKTFAFNPSPGSAQITGFSITSGRSTENALLSIDGSGNTSFNSIIIFDGGNPPQELGCVCCLGTNGCGQTCSSGGLGSSSCSSTNPDSGGSCSVSCSGGFYACCTPM